MKKFYILFFCIFLLPYSCIFNARNSLTPDQVFLKWQDYAKKKKYSKMFKYEYFYFANMGYLYNKVNPVKKWHKADMKEKKKFIKLYQKVMAQLLDKKKQSEFNALLRLEDDYQIKVVGYSVDLIQKKAFLKIKANYPDIEIIKLVKIDNTWYLRNPFGYHYYIQILKDLIEVSKEND